MSYSLYDIEYQEPFTKDNEEVRSLEKRLHRDFVNQIQNEMDSQELNRSMLCKRIGCESPMLYRALDSDSTITTSTLARLALAVNKKIKISLVDGD